MPPDLIYTIGHSNRTIAAFLEMLHAHQVKSLVDVRTVPHSRHNPQFGTEELAHSLTEAGITYMHIKALGGLRQTRRDSTNTGWKNASFRGYADYMQTPEFAAGLQTLVEIANQSPTAIMCAEAVPWRCHRSLIADALIVRDTSVSDIMSETRAQPHKLTSFAKVEGTRVTYPGLFD